MLMAVFGCEIPAEAPEMSYEVARAVLPLRFDISILNEGEDEYTCIARDSELFDISAPDKYPTFSGTVRYEATFVSDGEFDVLDLGQVGEACQVWLNGKDLGVRINSPYKFTVKDALCQGENCLTVEVKSNLGHRRRDQFSSFIQIPPTGLLGDVCLCKYGRISKNI